ncbi:unnamed protein product [Rotaria sp. Silwood1]|nr:unnamed protein product [Rotaria sp. Silwood1]
MNEYDLKKFLNNEDDSSTLISINNRIRLRSYTFFRLKSNNINKDDDEEIASSSDDDNEQTDEDDEDVIIDDNDNVGGDDDDDDDSNMLPLSEASSQLDQKNLRLYIDRPYHFQYYQLLEQVKHIGLSQRDLANICHLSFYSARSEIKSLTKNMKHISLKSVQLNQKGKIMENRIVLKKYMPTTTKASTSSTNNNIRQQIISKTPRTKRKKSNNKQKEFIETTQAESPTSLTEPSSNSTSFIKCEPIDAEHLDNEPLLSRLVSSEIIWRPSIQSVSLNEPPKKKSKTRVNPVKRINIKREHRLDLIRSYMNEHPICTLTDLRAAIMLSERDEGLTIHMDRKTLDKLVDELEKIHKFLFRFTARIKQSRTIICLAMNTIDITPNCERIQQFKIELSQETIEVPSSSSTTNKSKQLSRKNLLNTTNDQQDQIIEDNKQYDDDSKITIDHLFNNGLEEEKIALLKKKPLENITGFGNCYGYVYKFQRCAILHKFLFYLLYGYQGKINNEIIESTIDIDPPLVSNDPEVQTILDSIPTTRRYIGSNQGANWKTFVPPLDTRGRSIPSGCLYLDDFLMCMPVSIFLAIVYVPYKVPGLMELLSHPTKRYILVRDLPAEMRYPLVVRRHYLYRITEVLKYLSTLGLITFVDRPIISRLEKLNTLIYVHSKAYLINTINQTNNSNEPIENMSNYPKQIYNFISLTNINRYWFDLIEIALNTYRIKIFSRKQNRSHIIDILKQAIKPISIENINEIKIPLGKTNGPAGFDYDLYLFLRKSWKLPYNNKRILKLLNREANHCCIPVCELRVPIDVALKRSYTRHLIIIVVTTNENDISISRTKSSTSIRYQCSECSKSFLNRTSLVRHRHRQHEQHHQIKSNKTTLRPNSSTQNPLGRGRHATDTSSLSCCSINFILSNEFLHEQYQHFYVQKSLYTIDKLIERFPLYFAVYDQEQHIEFNENNLLCNTILNSHEFGLNFYQLYNKVKLSMTFSECCKQLHDYLISGIIIAAGSRTRIYVHRKHARSWLIYSIRFRQHDNNNNLETLLTSAFVDSTSSMTTMDTEMIQDNRQIKCLNLSNNENIINNNNQLILDQAEVRKL